MPELNAEQITAAHHPIGEAALLLAGAGSGKTTTLTERVSWLLEQGVAPKKILVITFTNKAANEIRERVLRKSGLDESAAPRLTTIHSLALSLIRRNPKGFGLGEKVSPLDDYDQIQLLKKIIQRESAINPSQAINELNVYHLRDQIGYHRARGIGFRCDYTDDVHAVALEKHSGYHALTPLDLHLWELFEAEKTANNVIDFDDMLHLVNRRCATDAEWLGKLQAVFEHVLMDECQDTSVVSWNFVNYLMGPTNRNLYCVGDVSQCQPPDTSVLTGEGNKPISVLDNQTVTGWSLTGMAERPCVMASNPYLGEMMRITTVTGKSTRVTPKHWLWVRLDSRAQGKFAMIITEEKGQYYLQVLPCDSLSEIGREVEQLWLLRIGKEDMLRLFPWDSRTVVTGRQHLSRTEKEDLLVFFRCAMYPLYSGLPRRGPYMKIMAACAQRMANVLTIPVIDGEEEIEDITIFPYDGMVHSLSVEKDETYIADGIVVGNSIYGFNGSSPDLILAYAQGWRGKAPALYRIARNHRSVPEIVDFANAIQSKMTATLPLQMESFRGIGGESGTTRIMRAGEPIDVARKIARQIMDSRSNYRDYAILVRSGSQIRDIEGEFVRARIPYVVRGGSSLLQTEEARDVISYLRIAVNPSDYAALVRATSAPKCGIGDSALEKVRHIANQSFKGDLIQAMLSQGNKFASFANTVREIQKQGNDPVSALTAVLNLTGYVNHLKKKYAKDHAKVEVKIENLFRLRTMIEGMVHADNMSIDDIIFRFTMDKMDMESERGSVTISTIHSAKGLEWPTVYVFNVVDTHLPHWRSMGDASELEEERRLWYVAVTRAKDHCVLCVPDRVSKGSNMVTAEPSRFLTEINVL